MTGALVLIAAALGMALAFGLAILLAGLIFSITHGIHCRRCDICSPDGKVLCDYYEGETDGGWGL